jgi:hypothetical protein
MPNDERYFAALEAAQAIINELSAQPDLPPHLRLSTATYLILAAMNRLDDQRAKHMFCPDCSVN